jgi:hypothetical protein
MMASRFEVPAENLAWRCDLSFLPFTCTAEMTPLEDFIGQDRAIRAIEFGLGVSKPGFNIFVTGLTGTARPASSRHFSKRLLLSKRLPPLMPRNRRIGVTSTTSLTPIGRRC